MKVLLLSPYPERLIPIIEASGDQVIVSMEEPENWPEADFIISNGYRTIIREPYLSRYKGRMVNIHTSLLPWNRGAHPNFWSWFDETLKGVTIHEIDAGVDTGTVLCGIKSSWNESHTLASSYNDLRYASHILFQWWWPNRETMKFSPLANNIGSFHRKADIEPFFSQLSKGWNTPVTEVIELGRKHRETGRSLSEGRG